jgi:hypothetical protein
MLNTLREFVLAVDQLADLSDAYYVFEERCSDKLRDQIYTLSDSNTPEPFRSAMINLGYHSY